MIFSPTPMTQEEHLLLSEVIGKQFGLSFPPERRAFLESRLLPRLQALHLKRYIDYYLLLQYDLNGELGHLARLTTNNETYFFREIYQFESLFGQNLSELRDRAQATGCLRFLSAGCSSGEEPYTLNIYAREAMHRLHGIRCQIDAFDIDADRLEMAREAQYGPMSLRSTNQQQRRRYFAEVAPERYELNAAYRQGVSLGYGNIQQLDSFRKPYPYDVVFCRNVLIYNSDSAFEKAILNFHQVLRPGGLLFLGHSESLIGRTSLFETVRLEHCISYRKVLD